VTFEDGAGLDYEALVTTIPLDEFIRRLEPIPPELVGVNDGLRYTSVMTVNLGLDREHVSDYHWVYFPESAYPFYRVGFPANLSAYMAPSGMSSLSIEISYRPTERPDAGDARDRVISALQACGLLSTRDVIVTEKVLDVPHAYVIFDSFRQRHLKEALSFLRSHDVYPVGRYALWTYSAMEDAILEGRALAETLS
jgi:UDP-galactopyranose mutase